MEKLKSEIIITLDGEGKLLTKKFRALLTKYFLNRRMCAAIYLVSKCENLLFTLMLM